MLNPQDKVTQCCLDVVFQANKRGLHGVKTVHVSKIMLISPMKNPGKECGFYLLFIYFYLLTTTANKLGQTKTSSGSTNHFLVIERYRISLDISPTTRANVNRFQQNHTETCFPQLILGFHMTSQALHN